MLKFIKAYIKSMRLYYSFVTGIVGWLGVSYYEYVANSGRFVSTSIPSKSNQVIILVLLFLSWGINQIINDFLGIKEDKINAPDRPMVTGELNPKIAFATSVVLMIFAGIVTVVFLNPIALIPLVAGTLLNVVYEYAKGYGILGNIVFGLTITTTAVFGFCASGPFSLEIFDKTFFSLIFLVWLNNSILTYYTYFKDYEGDKKAGKKTLVVKYGLKKASRLALVLGFIPSIFLLLFILLNFISFEFNYKFLFLAVLTGIVQIWNGVFYFKNPSGKKTYFALEINFRAYSCVFAMFISMFFPDTGLLLFITTYVFVGFLFSLHSNEKA